MLKREDYKAIKRMDRKELSEYLERVYWRGFEAGKKAITVNTSHSETKEAVEE